MNHCGMASMTCSADEFGPNPDLSHAMSAIIAARASPTKSTFDVKIVSRKIATVDREIEIPMLLMQADVEKAWNTFNVHARDRR